MGCNCGGNKTLKTYVYTSPDNKKTTYKTQMEAQAAVIRNNGGSFVTV